MVVFTAFELGCWKLLANAYRIETVSAVVSETQTGDPLNPRRVPVPLPELKAGLAAVHTPSKRDLATFATGHPRLLTLDPGERDLLTWLKAHESPSANLLWVTTTDKAALVGCNTLAWLDAVISLERLLQGCGAQPAVFSALPQHYREVWLSEIRTKIRLGIIP